MIKIIDYKAGNAPSVMNAVKKSGLEAEFARSGNDLNGAKKIILPGVGSADATMDSLRETGLTQALEECVLRKKIPFLGICVGMQILFERSEEGGAECLGWLKGAVKKFDNKKVRTPQMGWNKVSLRESPVNELLDGHFYFVNSYYAVPADESDIWGTADYNGVFAAAVQRGNIFGVQFHAEKSGEEGLALLNGFLKGGNIC